MGINDNGTFPEVSIRKAHFRRGEQLAEAASGKSRDRDDLSEKRPSGSRWVRESEHKKADQDARLSRGHPVSLRIGSERMAAG